MMGSMRNWLLGDQPTNSLTNITGTQHMAQNGMKFDSIDHLLGNLSMDGNQTMLNMPGQNAGFLNNYGGLALGALQGAGNLFMGMKQYGMAKDALKESKRQFNVNYDAQKAMTNGRLKRKYEARVAADPEAHTRSVDEYMNEYGVK